VECRIGGTEAKVLIIITPKVDGLEFIWFTIFMNIA
jgi:hypothetical protein